MNSIEENQLFDKIKLDDEKAFEILFHKYYAYLCAFASKIIRDDDSAEEIIQDLFVKLWDKRKKITIDSSLKSYLFRSAKNLCLNYLQHNKIKNNYASSVIAESKNYSTKDNFIEVGLAEKIETCIQELPVKRREIFRLSREDGLKYREIAEKLNISIKTVETQMSLAIKTLRDKLKKYNTFITLFLCIYKK